CPPRKHCALRALLPHPRVRGWGSSGYAAWGPCAVAGGAVLAVLASGKQLLRLLRVRDGVAAVVIVHQDVHFVDLVGHLRDLWHPLGELLGRVQVLEALAARLGALKVPRLGVSSVIAYDG